MPGPSRLPFAFVLLFLLFSAIFFYNAYKLWFRTDAHYQSLRESLTRSPSIYPFRDFFLHQLEDRKKWERFQKIFSIIGAIAVLVADALVLTAWLPG